MYDAVLKKLNQMEIRQKGTQKIQQLVQTYKNEREIFFEELEHLQSLQKGDLTHLNKLKR